MRTNKTVHIPKEKILVLTGDQALATGALNTTGNTVNLQNQQGGVLSVDQHSATTSANNFITAGNTALQVKKVKVLQGTPNSQALNNVNPFGTGHKAYLQSGILDAKKILSVSAAKPKLGVYDMQYMSSFTAPTVNIDYTLGLTLESHKRDAEFTLNKRDRMNVATHAVTGSPTSPTDELLQNWAADLNVNSVWVKGVRPFIVFGINPSPATVTAGSFVVGQTYTILTVGTTDFTLIGASANTVGVTFTATGVGAGNGTATVGTRINSITATKSIPFITHDGATYNFQSSITFVNSLTTAIAGGLSATAGIQVLNKTTAGAAANVTALLVVGLDEQEAVVFDDWTVRKVRVFADTSLANTSVDVAKAVEESGTGKQWYQRWKQIAAFDGTTYNVLSHPYHLSLENLPSYIDQTKLYTATIIEFEGNEETITVDPTYSHQLVILLEATVTNSTAAAGTAYTIATSDTTTVAALNASLGAWLQSASNEFSNIEYKREATIAAPFV